MKKTRFIMLGGFLGAGKTTTISRLARHFLDQGLQVVIVTNDQAADLVDTHNLRSQGFAVGEVAGACFCCNFNELTSTVEQLGTTGQPDVVLAEPVGSCTDLVATVIRPLVQVYQQPLDIRPYGVILKPSHGLRILQGEERSGFSPKAGYIFRKQIEEADFILINRIDELTPESIAELTTLLEREFPGRPVLQLSAKTGAGFDQLCAFLDQEGEFGRRALELDYDIYAEGEAELGWLNSNVEFKADQPIDLDDLLLQLIHRIQQKMTTVNAETAHLKVIGLTDQSYAVANLVSSFTPPELSLPSHHQTAAAHLVVNARVATDPEQLADLVRQSLTEVSQSLGGTANVTSLQSFRPGRPVPTHRIEATAIT